MRTALLAAAALAIAAAPAVAAPDLKVIVPRQNVPVVFGTPRVVMTVPPTGTVSVTLNSRPVEGLTRAGTALTGRIAPDDGLRLGRNVMTLTATADDGGTRSVVRTFYGVRRDPTMVTITRPAPGSTLPDGPVRIAFRVATPTVILRAWVDHREITGRLGAPVPAGPGEVLRGALVPRSLMRPGGNVLKVRAIGPRGRYETEFRPFRLG